MAINKYSTIARINLDTLGTFSVIILEYGNKLCKIRYCGHAGKALFGDTQVYVPTADLIEF